MVRDFGAKLPERFGAVVESRRRRLRDGCTGRRSLRSLHGERRGAQETVDKYGLRPQQRDSLPSQ